MMNILTKLREYLNVGNSDEEENYDEYEGYDEGYDEDEVAEARNTKQQRESEDHIKPKAAGRSNVIPIRKELLVAMFKPSSVEESRLVVDKLKEGHTVVLNLEGVRTAIAQRIVDFICGATYHMEGNLQSISESIFIVTPPNVGLSGDFVDLLGSTGSAVDYHSAEASGYSMRG